MKLLFYFLMGYFSIFTLQAQVVIEPHPSYTDPANQPFFDEILDADVYDASDIPAYEPSEGDICFDKKIKIKVSTSRGPIETCMFINTKIGLVGYSELRPGSAGICDILANSPSFKFNILGLKGDMFTYQNIQRKGRLEHWLQRYPRARTVEDHSGLETGILYKKDEFQDFLDGKVKGILYQYENFSTKFYVFGKEAPNKLDLQPSKFLGLFGVGYQYAEQGLFIIMAMEQDAYDAQILEMEDLPTCFNASMFRRVEEVALTKAEVNLEDRQERFDRQKAENPNPCQDLKQRELDQEKKDLAKNKAEYERVKQLPNVTSEQIQMAQIQTMMNYDDMMTQNILKTDYEICQVQQRLQHALTGKDSNNLQIRLKCLEDFKKVQQQKHQEIKGLKTQYPNNAMRQQQEAQRIVMSIQDDCR